jgi:hypothetical protein
MLEQFENAPAGDPTQNVVQFSADTTQQHTSSALDLVSQVASIIRELQEARLRLPCRDSRADCPHRAGRPKHSGRKALDRLQRLYIRHFRRELIRQQHYLEAAASRALFDMASSGVTG